jgi:hypothetical protein
MEGRICDLFKGTVSEYDSRERGILLKNNQDRPVPMAARSKARSVFDRSNTEVAGSNSARGMDVCTSFSVLCCSVQLEALRRADNPSKESYQMSRD